MKPTFRPRLVLPRRNFLKTSAAEANGWLGREMRPAWSYDKMV